MQDNTETDDKTIKTLTEQDQTQNQTKMGAALTLKVTIKVNKLDISINDTVKVTEEMLMRLPKSKYNLHEYSYDSDETIAYYPVSDDMPKKAHEVVLNPGLKAPDKPKRRLIKAHLSQGGFLMSVHGVKKQKS